jgi:hypothetical protein
MFCQNCGRKSHCGEPVWEDFRRQPYNHGIEGRIKVCGYCRCENCSPTSGIPTNGWTGPEK